MNTSMFTTRTGRVGVSPACRRCATCLIAVAAMALTAVSTPAQTPVDPETLADIRQAYCEQLREKAASARGRVMKVWGQAELADGQLGGGGQWPGRSADLYNGLPGGGWYWFWVPGPYWALDDGTMGPAGFAVGGGEVSQYEFAFGLHADFDGDIIQPVVIVHFWNAPLDPVGDASNPVVDPNEPVSAVMVTFAPITLPFAGDYVFTSGLLDLAAAGLEFDLDETFYVEIIPLKLHAGYPVPDPNVFACFSVGPIILGANQDKMWSDLWVFQGAGCGSYVPGNQDWFYDHPAEMDDGDCPGRENQSPIRLVGEECPGPILELSVNEPDDICVKPNEPVTVTLSQSCIPGLVRGYQAFLEFDTDALSFVSASYIRPDPYDLPIIDPIVANGSDIDVAAGIDDANGQQPTSSTADLVTLNFTAGTQEGLVTVDFRSHLPPTRFSDPFGGEVLPTLVNSPTILVDGTPPVFDQSCPLPDINVNADAGTCEASGTTVNPTTPTATDNLDPSPTVTFVRDDGKPNLTDPYEASDSPITITWTATDCAGNYAECTQTITVTNKNELLVNVELQGVSEPTLQRCITFELWECPDDTGPKAVVDEVITFTNGLATGVTVLVPCGDYNCITARDKLHTLRRTDVDDFGTTPIIGTQYVADFTDKSPGADDDSLIGGDLNDDGWIDILDFGMFSSQYATDYGPGDTDCDTPPPHADINGDGLVDTLDFTFIQINFLEGNEDNCCGAPGPGFGPRTRVSVAELHKLGLSELAVGDLNNDGWLDEADIEAFMQGARPKKPLQGPGDGANKAPRSVRPRP